MLLAPHRQPGQRSRPFHNVKSPVRTLTAQETISKVQTLLAGPLFLAAALFLFCWPLWLLGYRFPKGGGDLWGMLYPVWSFVAEWVRQGVFPLWNPRMMGGDPIIADIQFGLLNPFNWPLFWLISPPLVMLRGLFPLWWAGVGLYLYLRHSPVWQFKRSSALVGAIAYMFCDSFIVHLGNPPFNDAMAWLPWALLGIDHAARRSSTIPLAALPIALLLVSGHGQLSFYAALTIGLYGLWQALEGGWPNGLRRWGRMALAGIIGVALAAPALLPALERFPLTERAGTPLEARRGLEYSPTMLIDLLAPSFHGRGVDQSWLGWGRAETGYVGAVALYLAILGILGSLGQRRTWAVVLLGALAYELALGYRGWLYPRLAHLPLFSESWKTARAIFVLSLSLAVLAAQGMEVLRRRRCWPMLLWGGGLVAGGLFLWLYAPTWVSAVPEGAPRLNALIGLRFAALLAWGTAGLGWSACRNPRGGRASLILLLLAELVALGARAEMEPMPQPTPSHESAIAFLRADPGWFRVDVASAARDLWPPVLLQMEGFEVPQGAGNALDLREFNILRWRIPSATHPAYRMLGVKYIVVPKGAPPGGEGIWPVYVDDPTVDIHLNTLALPRVWLVYRTEVVTDYGEALERVLDENFRPEVVAVVQDGPHLNGAGHGRIEVGYYNPNGGMFYVENDAPALLVLSDTFYPGWQARVDGAPTPIYRTNAVFRGIPVPPGRHRVEIHYRPRSLQVGTGLAIGASLIGLLKSHQGFRRGRYRDHRDPTL